MTSPRATHTPQIGEIYIMEFSGTGSEQVGLRPGLIFQNNLGNMHSPNVIALPLTSSLKKLGQPTHVLLRAAESGLARDSVVLCENPERVSKIKIKQYITTLSIEDMKRVTEANLLANSAIAYLDAESLIRIWHAAVDLNASRVE